MGKKINENRNCHKELLAQLSENCDNVEKLALLEINNLQFVIPIFNNLSYLSKYQFSHLLKKIKKSQHSPHFRATLIGICVDSLTCMIENSSFYESYCLGNKVNLNLLEEMISTTYNMIVANNCHDLPTESLSALIAILERSATRIQFKEIAFFDKLTLYINHLKAFEKLCLDNKFKEQPTKTFNNTKHFTSVSESCPKEVNNTQSMFQLKKNSDISHVIDIKNDTILRGPFNQQPATNQNQITNFPSKVIQENKDVPQLCINNNTFTPKKQRLYSKRPMDDTNFNNEKENVQPPTKILKIEANTILSMEETNTIPSCYMKIEETINAFEVLMTQRVPKKK